MVRLSASAPRHVTKILVIDVTCAGTSLYPPTSSAALRRLIHAILSSPLDRLKQDCYLYYLLNDYDAYPGPQANGHASGSGIGMELDTVRRNANVGLEGERARRFARRRCIPRTWTVFMDGYWALDNAQWEVCHMSCSRTKD